MWLERMGVLEITAEGDRAATKGGREGLGGISGGAMGMKSKGSFKSRSLVRPAE